MSAISDCTRGILASGVDVERVAESELEPTPVPELEPIPEADTPSDSDNDCDDETSHQVTLSCGHMFHKECIVSWLRTRPSCPICRTRFDALGYSAQIAFS